MAKTTAKETLSSYRRILKEVGEGKYKPCYLLMGEEPYYVDKIATLVAAEALTEDQKAFNQMVLYGQDVTSALIVDNARRYPVMAPRQVIIVKEAQQLKGLDTLAAYFKSMNPSCVLVLCFMGKSVDKRTEFWKNAQKYCEVLESVPLRDYEMPEWISSFLQERNTRIEPQAARLLADFLGTDLQRVVMELEKLFLFMPEEHGPLLPIWLKNPLGSAGISALLPCSGTLPTGILQKCSPSCSILQTIQKNTPW